MGALGWKEKGEVALSHGLSLSRHRSARHCAGLKRKGEARRACAGLGESFV